MEEHWVSQIYPPKFEFKTVNDLLEKENLVWDIRTKESRACESYSKVYLDIVERENYRQAQSHDQQLAEAKATDRPTDRAEAASISGVSRTKDTQDCIWTNDEIRILRQSFQKLKVQNVYLVGMVDSLRQELHTCKERETVTNSSYSLLKEKWTELKKRYGRAKISCRSMKEDLKSYHLSLKTARKDTGELQAERNGIFKDLNETKSSLDLEKLRSTQLMSKIKDKELEKALALEHCEFITRQQCKFEETLLRKEIFRLKEELRKEKDENSINKKSLENLRNHFVSFKLSEQNDLKESDILSITDIDYTP